VGRRSREILIDAANLVFHDWMVQPGGEVPSPNDAKARIDGFLDQAAAGKAREDLRRVLRASHTLNNTVTHSNHTTRAETFAAAQATVLMVRTLQLLWDDWEPFRASDYCGTGREPQGRSRADYGSAGRHVP
jgi:hypothetical protein